MIDDDLPGDGEPAPGLRKDGKPYKEGNTREDGSYRNGKYRPPEGGKFREGDGRTRGKREPGSKNVSRIWERTLRAKRTIGNETKTNAEWLVDAMIRRGITRSDRAAEKSLGEAERIERALDRRSSGTDDDLIAKYFEQRVREMAQQIDDDDPDGSDVDENMIDDDATDGEDDDAHP